jgi:putative Ca2+/H+ antiporter (TMEM165/GDT1 family)
MITIYASVTFDVDDILENEDLDHDEFHQLVAGLIGEADDYLGVMLDIESTIEADAEEFKDHSSKIEARLTSNQKIVARAFLTALLAELGDA